MTKKLEEILNLPDSRKIIRDEERKNAPPVDEEERINIPQPTSAAVLKNPDELDKINSALPKVNGLGKLADTELDEVAVKSMEAYEDLMNLGMNVESRFSGRIFEVAANLLRTNLDAKVAKLDKKLKMVELQLKKKKIDGDSYNNEVYTEGTGYVVTDRNSLLERIKNINEQESDK